MLIFKQREALLEGTLVLDFLEIQLTQKKEDGITYEGVGSIQVDSEGQLSLKMFHKYKDSAEPLRDLQDNFINKTPPGQIIADDYYYSLRAVDFSGRIWVADSLLVSESFRNSFGGVIKSSIRELKTESSHNHVGASLAAWIPGKYQIPTNELTKTSTNSTRNVFAVENELFSCRCVDKEDFLEISVEFRQKTKNKELAEIFLEGLSLGLGKAVVPVYMIKTQNSKSVVSISSRSNTLPLCIGAPFRNQFPTEVNTLAKFLQNYLEKFNSAGNDFYGYWYRIFRSVNDELENRALVLSVSIEGILNKFFHKHGIPENKVIKETDDAIRALKRLKKCNSRFVIREQILNCLAHTKRSTAKRSLNKLEQLGVLEPKMAQTWSIIRNKSAHAHDLEPSQLQEYVNQYYVCLAIFYRLIFQHIGYSGSHINYAKLGFPEELFKCRAT